MAAVPERLAAAQARGGRIPDFFIVGHAKSGTTALYEMLRAHPQIFLPDVKEPQFFARKPVPADAGAVVGQARFELTGVREETLDDYLGLFAGARPDQLAGDASTFYLWSPIAAARIAEAQPGARILAILREPASFVRSLHLQMLQNNTETEKSLRRALELEKVRREGHEIPAHANWPAALIYSDRVRYVEQLQRFEAHFDPRQLLVLIYDDFRADNAATLRRVQRFLGVQEREPDREVRANPTVAVRSVRLYSATRDVRAGRGPAARLLRATGKAVTTRGQRKRFLYPMRRRIVYRAPPAPEQELMRELRERFRGEVEALSAHLARDLVHEWGYDGA